MTSALSKRNELPEKYTWNLLSVYPDDDAWEEAIATMLARLDRAVEYRGKLNSPANLADFLALSEEIYQLLGRIYVYGGLPSNTDTNDQKALANMDRIRGLFGRALAGLAFAQPELIAIGFETLRTWMAGDERLALYAHQFDRLERQQEHVRSGEVEEILGMVTDVFATMNATHEVLANGELVFDPAAGRDGATYPVTQSTIRAVLGHPDRALRRSGYEHYADTHLAYKNTMANALSAGVKADVFMARARGYADSLEAALKSNFIPAAVFHNLLDTFQRNLPTWHRYWALRRQALGVEQLFEYDLKAPLSRGTREIPYEQGVDMIAAGMAPLGTEYVSILRRGCLEERWVDVLPNEGKRMGAFSSGSKGTHPFIMMSYTPDLQGVSTLAHELGHSMHSYYTNREQPIMSYTEYGLFAAEVASNFNQALVRAHLLETEPDPEFQIALIEEAMSNFHRYFFIMPTLARFELEIHRRVEQGQALPAGDLIKLMADLFGEGYGSELVVDEERVGITWAEFHTHLYSNFYVYQYATGISAAHALADRVLHGPAGAADDYLAFLKAGGSRYPLEVLQLAGVDMASPEPVEKTFAVLASYVDRLADLLARRGADHS